MLTLAPARQQTFTHRAYLAEVTEQNGRHTLITERLQSRERMLKS